MTFSDRLADWAARSTPERLRRARWLQPRWPLVGVELRADALVVARLAQGATGTRLAGVARRALPDGLYRGALGEAASDPAALGAALAEALRMAGAGKAARISLAVPDGAVHAAIVDFAELPASRVQAEEMVRFRLRKTLPGGAEGWRMSWSPLGAGADGRPRVLAAMAPEPALASIEAACAAAGVRCGLIEPSLLALRRAVRRALDHPEDVGLLDVTAGGFALLVEREGVPALLRAKTGDAASLERDLRATFGYYEEHLFGAGLTRLVVRAAADADPALVEAARAAGRAQEVVAAAGFGDGADDDALPAVGLAARRAA
ncbi:MAG: hypothetical protein ABFD65_09280 [Candidatus Polarisedimenticolia bacterium]